MIQMESVSSGHIEAMGWEEGTMVIRFKGGAEYAYTDVSFDTFRSIKESDSVGKALHRSGLKGSRI